MIIPKFNSLPSSHPAVFAYFCKYSFKVPLVGKDQWTMVCKWKRRGPFPCEKTIDLHQGQQCFQPAAFKFGKIEWSITVWPGQHPRPFLCMKERAGIVARDDAVPVGVRKGIDNRCCRGQLYINFELWILNYEWRKKRFVIINYELFFFVLRGLNDGREDSFYFIRFIYYFVKIDDLVKSRKAAVCHFDRREKSNRLNSLMPQDFSLRSKWHENRLFTSSS